MKNSNYNQVRFFNTKKFFKKKKHLKIKGEGDKNYIKDNIRNCMCIKKSTYLYLYCLNKNIKMSSNFATRRSPGIRS